MALRTLDDPSDLDRFLDLRAERDRLDAELDAMPYATGNHWRAEKDGEVIHLIGTMHLSDPRLDGPVDRLRPVIAEAGALLLELAGILVYSYSAEPSAPVSAIAVPSWSRGPFVSWRPRASSGAVSTSDTGSRRGADTSRVVTTTSGAVTTGG